MTREAFDHAVWAFRPRLRYQSENISEMDFCPAWDCSAGFVVDDLGWPVLDEDGHPMTCSLCHGTGMLYEPCCPDCTDEHEHPVIYLGGDG